MCTSLLTQTLLISAAAPTEIYTTEWINAHSGYRAPIKRLRWKDLLMQAMEMGQVALTDPDVRLMKGPHGMVAGYNVQVAVDGRHGLIANNAVMQAASEQNQMTPVAVEAKAALGVEALDVVDDDGYGRGEQGKAGGGGGVKG